MPMNPLTDKKDLAIVLMEGLKKSKPKHDEEPDADTEDEGPGDYDPGKESRVKFASAIRLAIENGSDEALANALADFVDACS